MAPSEPSCRALSRDDGTAPSISPNSSGRSLLQNLFFTHNCVLSNLSSPTIQVRFAALNLRNLRLRGSLRYLVLTGVPDDSQRQIQTRQASPVPPIAEHLRASIHRIRPRSCSGHQSQRCRNVLVCHRESAVGISSSDRFSSSPLLRTGSSLWDCSPSRRVSVRNRVSSGLRPTPRQRDRCRHNCGPSTLSPVNSRLTPSPLRSVLQYLSTLSTSAPAPSVRVDPSASRRGTCDRGIWMKPLAFAADAGGLSLSMVFQWPFRYLIASGVPEARSSRNVGTAQRSLLSLKTQIL